MSDVALSYSREDLSKVRKFGEALRSRGWSIFIDREISPGAIWTDVLDHELRTATSVAVFWSKASVASPYVRAEAIIGFERSALVPVLLEKDLQLPVPLGSVQAADLSDWDGEPEHPGFVQVMARVKSLVDQRRGHSDVTSIETLREAVQARRAKTDSELHVVIEKLTAISQSIGTTEVANTLAAVTKRLGSELFEIAVVGRMKNGKSTLMNALMGPPDGNSDVGTVSAGAIIPQ
ncbi:MAG: TIR domain-containing protein [Hyphomicrobiaceae bacterium]